MTYCEDKISPLLLILWGVCLRFFSFPLSDNFIFNHRVHREHGECNSPVNRDPYPFLLLSVTSVFSVV